MTNDESTEACIAEADVEFDGEVEVMSDEAMLRSMEKGMHREVYAIHSVVTIGFIIHQLAATSVVGQFGVNADRRAKVVVHEGLDDTPSDTPTSAYFCSASLILLISIGRVVLTSIRCQASSV
jgi:hypothetical protein